MKIVRDIAYKESLLGDFYLPEGAVPQGGFPAALLIHGLIGRGSHSRRLFWRRRNGDETLFPVETEVAVMPGVIASKFPSTTTAAET